MLESLHHLTDHKVFPLIVQDLNHTCLVASPLTIFYLVSIIFLPQMMTQLILPQTVALTHVS